MRASLQHRSLTILFVVLPMVVSLDTVAGAESPPTVASLEIVGTNGVRTPLSLRNTAVSVEISAFVASTTVEQRFSNPYDHAIEAIYTFPLGDEAAVNKFEMQIGTRVVRGEIHRRGEARRIYDEARDQGLQTALLDQQRPNVFTQSVANIAPGHDIVVRLRTVEVLEYEAGIYQFTFPLVVGPRYEPGPTRRGGLTARHDGSSGAALPAMRRTVSTSDTGRTHPPRRLAEERSGHDVSIHVDLDAGVPIVTLGSPSHAVEIQREGLQSARIDLAPEDTLPNKDFVLRWGVFADSPTLGLLTHREGVDGYFTLLVQPRAEVEAEEAAPKEILMVLDTSGSMAGSPLELSKHFVRGALKNLGSRDRFNLIQFASNSATFEERSLGNDPESIDRALRWMRKLSGGGGTEMLTGLRAATKHARDPDRIRMVVFLTDGYIGTESKILEAVRRLPDDIRVFTMGIGSSVNHFLLDRMAQLGRGAYTFIPADGDALTAVERFREWVTRPYLTDLQIDWGSLPVDTTIPEEPGDLYSGQNLAIVGRYFGAAEGTLTVRGVLAGREWEQRIPVVLPDRNESHRALAAIWARRRIDALLMKSPNDVADEAEEEVTRIALEHHLMSPYTSFVAVDYSWVANPDGAPATVREIVLPPAGTSEEADSVDTGTDVEERVRVTASWNVVELESTSSSTRFSDEFVEDLPVPGRFYQNVLTLSQGVNDSNAGTHGSRSRDFYSSVGGVSNVDPLSGRFMSLVNADSIEEMELVTGGAGVEFGRAQGGFARIIQKQGGNEFEGSVRTTWRSDLLDGRGTGSSDPRFDGHRMGVQLLGPLVKDRLWFRLSHEWLDWDEPVDALGRMAVTNRSGTRHDGQITWQISPRNKLAFRFAVSSLDRDRVDVSSMVSDDSSVRLGRDTRKVSLQWTLPWSPSLLIETTAAAHDIDGGQQPANPLATNACVGDSESELLHARCYDGVTRQFTGPARRRTLDDGRGLSLASTATWYAGHFAGMTHQMKLGLEVGNEDLSRETTLGTMIFPESDHRGADHAGALLARIPLNESGGVPAGGSYLAFFVEDQLKPRNNLEFTVGLRYGYERITAGEPAERLQIESRRVSPQFNVSWDPWSTGKQKLWFSARRHHADLSPDLALAAFDPASVDIALIPAPTGKVPAPGAQAALNVQLVDPALEAPHHDEWILGYEIEIFTETRLGLSWIRRNYANQLGVRNLRLDGPVDGADLPVVDGRTVVWGDALLISDGNQARYEAIALELLRRQYRSWEMQASYTWSESEGDAEPLNLLLGDEQGMLPSLSGRQSDDRRHVLKAVAALVLASGFRLGGALSWQSGAPWSPLAFDIGYGLGGTAPRVRLDYVDGTRNGRRNEPYWNVDLRLAREVSLGRGVRLQLSMEAFNLFNDDSLRIRNERWQLGRQIDGRYDATRRFGRSYQLGALVSF